MSRCVTNTVIWASTILLLVFAAESHQPILDDAVDETAATTTSDTVVIQPSEADDQLQRTFVWTAARANPGRRRQRQRQSLPSPSVQLVGVDVQRIQRKEDATSFETNDEHNSTKRPAGNDMTLADEHYLARIRRKNFRLMTILKSINDRIGRGASPPPPPVQWATMSMPGWNATSFDCDADASTLQVQRRRQHECDDLPLSDMTEMAVGDVHIVATSCARRQSTPTNRRQHESMEHVDDVGSGDNDLWLEFDGLTTTRDCSSGDRIRRSRLLIHMREKNSTDKAEAEALTLRRTRRRELKRSLREKFGMSFAEWQQSRKQRKRNLLLLSVYQKIILSRRHQRNKLKLVGKKRFRASLTGWLRVNVQPRLSVCGRRRRGYKLGQPLVLLVCVTDIGGSTAVDSTQMISTPAECSSTTQLDSDTAIIPELQDNLRSVNSTQNVQPYLEMTVDLPTASDSELTGTQHRRLHRSSRGNSAVD